MPTSRRSSALAVSARGLTLLFLLLLGCKSESAHPAATIRDPGRAFMAAEERLLQADTVRLAFQVSAEGAFTADLRGKLETWTGDVRLNATGTFGGQPADLMLWTDGARTEFGNGGNRKITPTPTAVREAVLVGMMRMGILHNLARLARAAAPDHAEGGVREWVVVDSFTVDSARATAMAFNMTVAGERSGSASLELDPRGGPMWRRVTVRFASGEMRVVERYSDVTIVP